MDDDSNFIYYNGDYWVIGEKDFSDNFLYEETKGRRLFLKNDKTTAFVDGADSEKNYFGSLKLTNGSEHKFSR